MKKQDLKSYSVVAIFFLAISFVTGCSDSRLNKEFELLQLQSSSGFSWPPGSGDSGYITVNAKTMIISYEATKGNGENGEPLECSGSLDITADDLDRIKDLIGSIGYHNEVTGLIIADAGADTLELDGDTYYLSYCPKTECLLISEEDHCKVKTLMHYILQENGHSGCVDFLSDCIPTTN